MDDPEIVIRWASGPEEVRGAVAVRGQVFCREQGVPRAEEIDGRDEEAEHLVALDEDGRVIATLRLLVNAERAKVGRVAVERRWRRRGVASRMLALALARAREQGCAQVRLAAQLQSAGLYRRAGFTVDSEPFEEAGIAHVWMERPLASAGMVPRPHPGR